MTPHPPYLPPILSGWESEDLFYIVKHGVKFTDLINPSLFVAEAATDAGITGGPSPDWARVDELARELVRAIRMRDPGAVNAAVDALASAMNALAQV